MKSSAKTVEEYIEEISEDRKIYFIKLRQCILDNLPDGFAEEMNYGMLGYVVPHKLYPAGYHCNTKLPLPFINIANQKNSINFYHMGIYALPELYQWFLEELPKHTTVKPDMGKSCIRFKKAEQIPFELIGQLIRKISVADWITIYEEKFKK